MATFPAGTASDTDGIEWRKQRNERILQRKKEDKLPQFREVGSNTKWTLEKGVALSMMCFFRGKNGAVPYLANHDKQIAWWDEQERNGVYRSYRTILMNIAGCPAGTKEHSPKIETMQKQGKTAEAANKRKREGYEAASRSKMGQDQKQSVEGVAIHLLLVFFRAVIASFDRDWEVMPVFDGLEADFMMRRKEWELDDAWVPMQMKSASRCIEGKGVTYSLTHGEYPNVFCVCVGLLGFEHRTCNVTGPNDIANAPGCFIGEIWNIGSCSNITKSLNPTFGVSYSKFPESRRLHFPCATDEAKRNFAEALLRDIEAWRPRLARNRVFYEFGDTINKKVADNIKIEKNGFEIVDVALRTSGLRVEPTWRQGECVDYAVASVESGEPLIFVSGKTGAVMNHDPKQRQFHLSGSPNKRFCDVVVAVYSGAHHRVAVIRRDKAYVEGKKSFCWNEDRLDPGVRVFDDIRNPQVAKAFSDYIRSFAAPNS